MIRWVATGIRLAIYAAIAAAFGAAAYRWSDVLPLTMHGAVFASGSLLGAIVLTFGGQVFGKFDRLLQDSEQLDYVRTTRVYRYIGAARKRVAFWMLGSLACVLITGSAAYLVKDQELGDLRGAVAVGYAALTIVVLAAIRIVSAYLRIDGFRLALMKTIENERRRSETLRAMRPAAPIREIPLAHAAER